eukprot:3045940-Rhodomonas_salina.1
MMKRGCVLYSCCCCCAVGFWGSVRAVCGVVRYAMGCCWGCCWGSVGVEDADDERVCVGDDGMSATMKRACADVCMSLDGDLETLGLGVCGELLGVTAKGCGDVLRRMFMG